MKKMEVMEIFSIVAKWCCMNIKSNFKMMAVD